MSPEDVERCVDGWMRELTLREKISLLSGRDSWSTMPIERLGIPGLVMTDGPNGARASQPDAGRALAITTTAFPTGVSMASTWNPALIEELARALAEETLAVGCDILLGPCVNIVRTPIAGRNFESYGEDPYLTGQIGTAYVKGLQSAGVGASLKHYAANNQEIERMRGSSEVDERTLREIYLPHFETIVKEAKPWTVMCAYNRINGEYASQHFHLLNEILKDEWGFEGVVVSDWTANHTITESLEGGLDLEMPGPALYYGDLLFKAVNNWQIEESVIDQAARRVLRMVAQSGRTESERPAGAANTPEHQALARHVSEEAIVLLKNTGALPLKPETISTLAVIGSAAEELSTGGGGSAFTEPPYRSSPLSALRQKLGQHVEVRYEPGADNWIELPVMKAAYISAAGGESGFKAEYFKGHGLQGEPAMTRVDPRLDFFWFSAGPSAEAGPVYSARWSGKLRAPATGRYAFNLSTVGSARLLLDGQQIASAGSGEGGDASFTGFEQGETAVALEFGRDYDIKIEMDNAPGSIFSHIRLGFGAAPEVDDRIERAVELAREADAALVVVGTNEQFETEGLDKPNLRLPGRQDELVQRVAEANPNTIVVLNAGAAVEMPWIEQVAAVVQAHLPGMEGGEALARVLTGEVNPSGKLTASYPVRLEDTPSFTNLSVPGARETRYGEGIFVGYRFHDKTGLAPLFPFGHGLSYSSFEYTNLRVPEKVRAGAPVEVSLDVTNTGAVPGKETVQIYVRDVQSALVRPEKELKGFQKIELAPGQTGTVRCVLDGRALSYYDPVKMDWVLEPGEFEVLAGASSGDVRLRGTFVVEE